MHEALTDLGTDVSELTYLRLGGDLGVVSAEEDLEERLGVLAELREQGLIRRIGLSGASPGDLARAQRVTPIAAVQNRFNLLDRSGVRVLADCEAQDILFVPYFPLAAGRLTGYAELTAPAERLGATPAQIALAWLLRRSPAVVAIPGTTNPGHLRANVAAGPLAAGLTDAEVTRLTALTDESTAALHVRRPVQHRRHLRHRRTLTPHLGRTAGTAACPDMPPPVSPPGPGGGAAGQAGRQATGRREHVRGLMAGVLRG
ncbi:hypothetical protein JCM9534A_11940 [Catenuloplanes indicus JCM 9534]|uniref:Aryl-alcohol dehydrogenase-like predicted oxidoreductase n=1 Tax=Catenuloplanes indicus TaxID=137267 RepID=A0AAE3VV18_9ACTN|nr:aryl-alcohol dehydrogenase-like predicted oxidoreductase [Catenuloplanes indicus]